MKHRLLGLLTCVLIAVALLAGYDIVETRRSKDPEPPKAPLYILMYHSFVPDGTDCNAWTTTESRFREDLQWIVDHGYRFVSPSFLASGEPLPEKAVMLTFDDGYADNYEIAYPILKEFGAPAVIALITKRIVDAKPGFLTWDMCREMLDSGLVEIGSHGHDVHALQNQGVARNEGESQADYEARVFPDIQTSIDLIQQELGVTPIFFAYPYGRTDPWITDFIEERFSVTVTTDFAVADVDGGLYNMPRFNMSANVPITDYLPE